MSNDRKTGRGASHADWAAERVVADPEGCLHPDDARSDYLMWCSDRMVRPEVRSRMRRVLVASGARAKGRGPDLRFVGVALRPDEADSGYRAGGRWVNLAGPHEVLAALRALREAGLVTGRDRLNRAWRELTR